MSKQYDINFYMSRPGRITLLAYEIGIDDAGYGFTATHNEPADVYDLYTDSLEDREAIGYLLESPYWYAIDSGEYSHIEVSLTDSPIDVINDYWQHLDEWRDTGELTDAPEPLKSWIASLPDYEPEVNA